MLRLDPPIPLETPRGDAMAHFLIDRGDEHHLRWVCCILETGECWTFRNTEIRFWRNVTEGRDKITPFSDAELARHSAAGHSEPTATGDIC